MGHRSNKDGPDKSLKLELIPGRTEETRRSAEHSFLGAKLFILDDLRGHPK
jgi:hypothetical protein